MTQKMGWEQIVKRLSVCWCKYVCLVALFHLFCYFHFGFTSNDKQFSELCRFIVTLADNKDFNLGRRNRTKENWNVSFSIEHHFKSPSNLILMIFAIKIFCLCKSKTH